MNMQKWWREIWREVRTPPHFRADQGDQPVTGQRPKERPRALEPCRATQHAAQADKTELSQIG